MHFIFFFIKVVSSLTRLIAYAQRIKTYVLFLYRRRHYLLFRCEDKNDLLRIWNLHLKEYEIEIKKKKERNKKIISAIRRFVIIFFRRVRTYLLILFSIAEDLISFLKKNIKLILLLLFFFRVLSCLTYISYFDRPSLFLLVLYYYLIMLVSPVYCIIKTFTYLQHIKDIYYTKKMYQLEYNLDTGEYEEPAGFITLIFYDTVTGEEEVLDLDLVYSHDCSSLILPYICFVFIVYLVYNEFKYWRADFKFILYKEFRITNNPTLYQCLYVLLIVLNKYLRSKYITYYRGSDVGHHPNQPIFIILLFTFITLYFFFFMITDEIYIKFFRDFINGSW